MKLVVSSESYTNIMRLYDEAPFRWKRKPQIFDSKLTPQTMVTTKYSINQGYTEQVKDRTCYRLITALNPRGERKHTNANTIDVYGASNLTGAHTHKHMGIAYVFVCVGWMNNI